MRVSLLQISNNFTINVLYDELFSRLLDGQLMRILAPTFKMIDVSRYNYDVVQYGRRPSVVSRLQFKRNSNLLWRFSENTFDFDKDINLVHAHTLFSDGVIAYKAYQKYGTPYIVAVRNTDINVFFKYFLHLRDLGKNILKNATKIIMISPVYIKKLQQYLAKEEFQSISKRIQVIPNGLGEIWLNNRYKVKRKIHNPVKLIFCGSFDRNKNILRIIKAAEKLNKVIPIELKLIGVRPNQRSRYVETIRKTCSKSNVNIEIIDRMPHKELISYYRECDIFVMPSHAETFGLVYVEALSQGLPIIYTKGEGFDGFYPDGKVGYSVNSHSVDSIADGINRIIENYAELSNNVNDLNLENFSWDVIAKEYRDIYENILR